MADYIGFSRRAGVDIYLLNAPPDIEAFEYRGENITLLSRAWYNPRAVDIVINWPDYQPTTVTMPLSDRQFRERQEAQARTQRAEADRRRAELSRQMTGDGNEFIRENTAIQNAAQVTVTWDTVQHIQNDGLYPTVDAAYSNHLRFRADDFILGNGLANSARIDGTYIRTGEQGLQDLDRAITDQYSRLNTTVEFTDEPAVYTGNGLSNQITAASSRPYQRLTSDELAYWFMDVKKDKPTAPAMSQQQAQKELDREASLAWLKDSPWG